jgi:hypothetical protein
MKRKDESFRALFEQLSTSDLTTLRTMNGCITYHEMDEILMEIKTKRKEKRYG